MVATENTDEYEPTYRQGDVDQTLEEHDRRISRLEKAGLVAVGYGLAKGSDIIVDISSFIL